MVNRKLDRALLLAARLHAGQEREGDAPLPYLTHPVEVLVSLRYVGGETDEDLLCAAALHDVVEESGADLKEIARETSERTAALVDELSRYEPTDEEKRGLGKEEVWGLRAKLLLDEIRAMSPDAQKVKLADRLANVREARRTKAGPKWDRYAWQSEEILKIVPRERNPAYGTQSNGNWIKAKVEGRAFRLRPPSHKENSLCSKLETYTRSGQNTNFDFFIPKYGYV